MFYSVDKPSLLLSNQDFESIVFRGIDKNYDINKFNELFIKEGKVLSQINKNEILISSSLAQRNDINLNQEIRIFFNKDFNQNIPDVRSFKVIGFFRTEFSEFDNNIILGNIEDILVLPDLDMYRPNATIAKIPLTWSGVNSLTKKIR